MPRRPPPIARVPLARSRVRLLAIPVAAVVAGAAAAAAGLLAVGGPIGLALAGAGAVMIVLGLAGAAVAMSVHLDVEEAHVRVGRLGGERLYTLVPGPVTRVRLRGEDPSRLVASPRFLPWQLGRGRLRGEEDVEVVRLAPTATAILVPTDRGRLAIAAANEEQLLRALSEAAQARQRGEEQAAAAAAAAAASQTLEPPEPEVEAVEPAEPEPAPEWLPETEWVPETEWGAEREWVPEREWPEAEWVPERQPEPQMPRPLTGIERALLEQQAEGRAVAVAVAPPPEVTAPAAAAALAPPVAAPEVVERPAVEPEPAPAEVAETAAEPEALPEAVPLARPRPSLALVLLPLVGAAAALGAGAYLDRLPAVGSDLGRLTALALVLAGPAATIGAIMARVWWPRLVGVVVTGALAAAVFIGRAIVGG